MPKRKDEDRDFYSDWELAEMDGTLHVQYTAEGWRRAIERIQAADKIATAALERAMAVLRNRRDGEVE
jgi:hypothetical protein